MIYRIYDRYGNDTIAFLDIAVKMEKMEGLLKDFHIYLHKKIENDEADDDLTEFCVFLETKNIHVNSCDYEEIDL